MQEKLRAIIKLKRIEKGYTQEKMANMLNYRSKSTYNLLENGPTGITINQLKDISNFLDMKEEIVPIFLTMKFMKVKQNTKWCNWWQSIKSKFFIWLRLIMTTSKMI
jgi:transcriptional regulator with XRE-family HTH domain